MSLGNGRRYGEKTFPNGDIYIGYFDNLLPHGHGKYTWSDGAMYEGEWENGKIAGKGYIFWPSGSIYEGELCGGFLHGYGSFSSIDGSVYKGSWWLNTQHGLGIKSYPNSDNYEGLWREGLQEGIGKYIWGNGNMYVGTWKSGKMSGRGALKWQNGALFNGHWLDGLKHGTGYYYLPDGSCYLGTWSKGLKDGRGTYYPAGSKPPFRHKRCKSNFCNKCARCLCPSTLTKWAIDENKLTSIRSDSIRFKISSLFGHSGRISNGPAAFDCYCNFEDFFKSISLKDFCVALPLHETKSEIQNGINVVYEREYVQGVLKMERILYQHLQKSERNKAFHKTKKKTLGGRGETIHKGHKSYYLMLNLQLGIRYTVGKITPVPVREVRCSDFGHRAKISMYFPHKGSQFTPSHYSFDFHWKDYCPMVFRNLREMFKIDAADYMVSVCGGDGLKELFSPGKSGSIFYLSQDERFVIKTLRKIELKVLLRMLPMYYDHVGAHENTLITKFFGLHRITIKCGQKIRFVVMGNMFCTELCIHRRYDLKGSSYGRSTSADRINGNSTLKDLDLPYVFHLEKPWRDSLFKQISLDCMFLESQNIVDYSMLLGLHFMEPECLWSPIVSESEIEPSNLASDNFESSKQDELIIPPKGLVLVAHQPASVSSVPGSHIRGSTLRASAAGAEEQEVDLLLPGTGRLRVQLGVNMPAQAYKSLLHNKKGLDSPEATFFEVHDVVLYFGIIDILQKYNITKKVESACKSLKHDPLTISAVEPKLYLRRFINFLEKVFP